MSVAQSTSVTADAAHDKSGSGLYVVTAQPPTSVGHTLKCNFTHADDLNLIVGKYNRFELYLVDEHGLKLLIEVPIYGKIAAMEAYRPEGSSADILFLSTDQQRFMTFSWNSAEQRIETLDAGDLSDRCGRLAEEGQKAIIDPLNRVIVCYMHQGFLKVLPMFTGEEKSRGSRGAHENTYGHYKMSTRKGKAKIQIGDIAQGYNCRIEELSVISLVFLTSKFKPLIAILTKDSKNNAHIHTYYIDVATQQLLEGPWKQSHIDGASNMLIPVPNLEASVIVYGERTATFYGANGATSAVNLKIPINMKCWTLVDSQEQELRYLLGDFLGHLYFFQVTVSGESVSKMDFVQLGKASIGESISYLDNSYAFIGSHYGNSQLIRFLPTPVTTGEEDSTDYVEIVQEFTNLAPMTDFVTVDLDKQGQSQLVGCSGSFQSGSIRVVRNGIGIQVIAGPSEMPGVKGLWSLKRSEEDEYDEIIALSFIGETRFLLLCSDEDAEEAGMGIEEMSPTPFITSEPTISISHVSHNQIVQIVSTGIALFDCGENLEQVSKWEPPMGEQRISVASVNREQVVVVVGGKEVFYFEVQKGALELVKQKTLEHEISCLDISTSQESRKSDIVAFGCWTDMSVRIMTLPGLEECTQYVLKGDVIPRSILLQNIEKQDYVFVGMGDGHLFTFCLNKSNFELSNMRKLALGTQPITLTTLHRFELTHVFAGCDRPSVIYGNSGKLVYSNVNMQDVTYMTTFHTVSNPYAIAFADRDNFFIGSIDEIQKLHVLTHPLENEFARRIAYQESTRSFGVVTMKTEIRHSWGLVESDWFKVLDDQTFEIADGGRFRMDEDEKVQSICSMYFEDDPVEYFVVGTAIDDSSAGEECEHGRIIVLQVNEQRQIRIVTEIETNGSVFSVVPFQGMLLAGINSKVQLYRRNTAMDGGFELTSVCGHHGNVLVISMVTRGEFIAVADLVKSVSLLRYVPAADDKSTPSFVTVGRDYTSRWMTSLELLEDDVVVGTEAEGNLHVLKRNTGMMTDEERKKFEAIAEWGLGDVVNRIRKGSIVMNRDGEETIATPQMIFCTIHGAIGVIATIPSQIFGVLSKLQRNMQIALPGVGNLKHEDFRAYMSTQRSVPAYGIIDGDLIERFLDLSREQMKDIVEGVSLGASRDLGGENVGLSVEEIIRIVEGCSACH